MKSSRLFYAVMMTFWVLFLALLAMLVTFSPQGGVELAGLTLFVHSETIDATIAAMTVIGLSDVAQSVTLGVLGGFNLGAAGLVLFSMMFCVFGQESEQCDARPLAEAAAACVAASCVIVVAIGFAGGQTGSLMWFEFLALGGVVLTVLAISGTGENTPRMQQKDNDGLDGVIADHAAAHAAFNAQLASLSRGEART